MSSSPDARDSRGPRQRQVEIGVAAFMVLLGLIAMYGSLRVGTGWGDEGPKSGFFPFWVGVLIVGSSAWNLIRAIAAPDARQFASWGQLREVGRIVLPMAVYVGAVPFIGIYIASAFLIAGFMRWLGRYGWLFSLAIAIALPIVIYITFEKWFLVPLPKGPVEDWLGL